MSGDLEQDCIQTFGQVKDELEQVEDQLARKIGLRSRDVRRQLFVLARQEMLVEDDLVERWHELYAVYMDWLRWESPSSNARKGRLSMPNPVSPCMCRLETSFGYAEDYDGINLNGKYEVFDAECETVAICPNKDMAELVTWALNKLDDLNPVKGQYTVCPLHWGVEKNYDE